MAAALVHVDTARSGRSQAGVVWAGIYVRLDDVSFPDEQWTDFAVVVLGWWMSALLVLLRRSSERQDVMFMEGPFSVELQTTSASTWKVTCVERKSSSRVIRAEAVVHPHGLVTSAARAAGEILALCRSREWWSTDADVLESTLEDLKLEIETLRN